MGGAHVKNVNAHLLVTGIGARGGAGGGGGCGTGVPCIGQKGGKRSSTAASAAAMATAFVVAAMATLTVAVLALSVSLSPVPLPEYSPVSFVLFFEDCTMTEITCDQT